MKITDRITEGLKKATPAEMLTKVSHALDSYGKHLKSADEHMYWKMVDAIHVAINGKHFSREVANMAVSNMENVDGTMGEYWSYEATVDVAKSSGIVFDKFNECDWYYVMNMIHSDFSTVVGTDVQLYMAMTKAWLMDVDAPEGKAYIYWKNVIMCEY